MTSVLDGVRVLDLSWGVAGPIAGMLLADHGADIVKVEPPGGDPFRGTPGYAAWLRGRRSVELDLRAPGDHAAFLALAPRRRRPARELRAGYDATARDRRRRHCSPTTPRLVYCSITPYGGHPAHESRPGYDALVAARLGIMHEQRGHFGGSIPHMNGDEPYLPDLEIPEGMAPGSPRSGPIFTYTPWLSWRTAFLATIGINAALFARAHTGRGQHVETSMLQAALVIDGGEVATRRSTTTRPASAPGSPTSARRRVSSAAPTIAGSSSGCRTRGSCSRAPTATRWTAARRRPVRDDPDRVVSRPENLIVLAHYFPEMAEAVARFPSDEWVRVAAEAGVPLQPVRTPEEALARPRARAEGAVIDVEHPEHGTLRQVGIVYGLSRDAGTRPGTGAGASASTPTPIRAEAAVAARADTPARRSSATVTAPRAARRASPCSTSASRSRDRSARRCSPTSARMSSRSTRARDPWWHANHIAYGANRGKRSIGIDLKTPEGLAVLHRLVEQADVVHSNMRRPALAAPPVSTKRRCARSTPTSSTATPAGFDRGPRSDSPGQRPDRVLARRRHLRRRRLSPTAAIRSGASRRSATPATASSRRSV